MQGTIPSTTAAAASSWDVFAARDLLLRWTMLILENVQNGQSKEGLSNFWRMLLDGVKPDRIVLSAGIAACSSQGSLLQARKMYALVASTGWDTQTEMANALASMFGRCGNPAESKRLFDTLEEKSGVSWNAMISAFAQNGQNREALRTFRQMGQEGVPPIRATFLGVLNAVSASGDTLSGDIGGIHLVATETGYEATPVVGSALLNTYGKCGRLQEARLVFERMPVQDLVAWNMILGSYALRGYCREVLRLWRRMQVEGVTSDHITFRTLLVACSDFGYLEAGRCAHRCITELGLGLDPALSIAVINMYGKCCRGSEEELCKARLVFEAAKDVSMDVVLWNAMLAAYTQNGQSDTAIRLYHRMQLEGIQSTNFTVATVLSACSNEGAVREGTAVHTSVVIEAGYEAWDEVIVSTLLHMYGKCGRVLQARGVFDRVGPLLRSSVFTWTTMIAAYAHNGHVRETLELCKLMVLDGVAPNSVTFVTALSLCGHAGKMAESLWCWRLMVEDLCISPIPEHIGCMVHLLGRAGWLQAEDLGMDDDEVSWALVLQSSIERGDTDRAERAALRLFELEPANPANYIALYNMYMSTKNPSCS